MIEPTLEAHPPPDTPGVAAPEGPSTGPNQQTAGDFTPLREFTMPPKIKDQKPEESCRHCGDPIQAETFDELYRKYSKHVIEEHGRPGSAFDGGSS